MYLCLCVPCSVMLVIPFINIIVQGYNFGALTNDRLQGVISLKVLEHDEEHKQVHKTYLVAAVCVCVNRVTWTGGAYGSYILKGPCEVRVFGFDALALDDAL